MKPLFKIPAGEKHSSVFQPGEHGIQWLGLEVINLKAGEEWQGATGSNEAAFVILGGRCTISVGGQTWSGLGSRPDIFGGPPAAVYAPKESQVTVIGESTVEVAVAKSPSDVALPPTLIKPEDVRVVSAGMSNWRRDVHLVIAPGSPISQRLIVGETINPPGNWSGVPPHKHDQRVPGENFLEEFYLFKVRPADSYGLQLMYRDGEGQGHIIGNNDVTVMLSGYHPTVASPGTTIGYLWTLAGEVKDYDIVIDPRFSWVANAEAVLKEERR